MLKRFWGRDRKEEKKKKIVAFIDYDNISSAAIEEGKIIDFKKIKNEFLKIGLIEFAFICAPADRIHTLPASNGGVIDLGFNILLCPRRRWDSDKIEDSVDIHIIQAGLKFIDYDEITDVVIVSNDGHMIELVKEAQKQGKAVSVFSTAKISAALKRVVGSANVRPAPLK